MSGSSTETDTYDKAAPTDLVSFSVICQPKSGGGIDEFRTRLTLDTVREYVPREDVHADVADQLRKRGFQVFTVPSPVVSARGPVSLFHSVFGGELVKLIRRETTGGSERSVTAIVLRPGSKPPSAERIRGALFVVVPTPPLLVAPSVPPLIAGFNLHLPGDVALLTRASATHRRCTVPGERATGQGIAVAVIDTGFARHAYYRNNGYQITRIASPDTADPEDDDGPHGTCILACLLACAPDVDAYGIKMGPDPVLAISVARAVPQVKVISISWVYNLPTEVELPFELLPLELSILLAVSDGVTVVAAAGNGQPATFPAMMPEALAVGGVAVDENDKLSAWGQASSFSSAIFGGRDVPDCCGIASDMLLPVPGREPTWLSLHGTSCATPQVAGVAALLLQKQPGLTPQNVRDAILGTAKDVTTGVTASGDAAHHGTDRATGAGLVNALKAWQSV